jgi:hypothetical protein
MQVNKGIIEMENYRAKMLLRIRLINLQLAIRKIGLHPNKLGKFSNYFYELIYV